MPSTKRPGDDVEGGPRKKLLNVSSRTGQACDRCKIRKIRCDARIGGCSPCLQNNAECTTTDRITGRATSRGHTEKIENENSALRMYMLELQQQLKDNGVEPKPGPSPQHDYPASPTQWPPPEQQASGSSAQGPDGAPTAPLQTERHGSHGSVLPDFRPGLIGDNYLGVSSSSSWLTPIEGTSLTLFGMKIDLADYIAPDLDAEASPTSYQTFLDHAFGSRPATANRPPLPPYDDCKVYAGWYFQLVQQFLPILHKPDFMALLDRVYTENHKPDASEIVSIHMVLAMVLFQYSSRNGNEQTRLESMQHYHYALSFVPVLIKGHQLRDIQALAMICQQLRNQARVGAAWMFTTLCLNLAIELGLHRSARAWPEQSAENNAHIIEMRKRIFWSMLVIQINIGGKLGRPMPLRIDDFDIEIPEALDDNLLSEGQMNKWRKCSFRAGLQGMKLNRIEMQVWSIIYSVRAGSGLYDSHLQHLEKELQAFKTELPPELSGGAQTREESQVSTLYLQLLEHEIRLLLHHPGLSRSLSAQVISNSYDVCLDTANKILQVALHLKALQSLDTSWYFATDFLAAIFTTLFVYTQRKSQITSVALKRLKGDMDAWIEVMGDVGFLLGTGPRLAQATRAIINKALDGIERHLATKTASAAVASTTSPDATEQTPRKQKPQPPPRQPTQQPQAQIQQTQHQQPTQPSVQHPAQQQPPPPPPHQQTHSQPSYQDANGYAHAHRNGSADSGINSQHSYPLDQTQQPPTTQQAYSAGGQFTYPPQEAPEIIHFASANLPHYDRPGAYSSTGAGEDIKPRLNIVNQPTQIPDSHAQTANFLNTFQSPSQASPADFNHAHHQQVLGNTPQMISQPAAWRSFTDSMMVNMGGHMQPSPSYMQQQHAAGATAMMAPEAATGPGPVGSDPGAAAAGGKTFDLQAIVAASMDRGSMAALQMQISEGQQPWPLIFTGMDGGGLELGSGQ